jgi:hypothetical protein
MRSLLAILAAISGLSACASGPVGPGDGFVQRPGQGVYVRPEWMQATPPPRIPQTDTCGSQLYASLEGVHEGAIYIPGLPGAKRIIRPAIFEGPVNDFMNGEMMANTYVQVETYQSGLSPFVPIQSPRLGPVRDRITIGPEQPDRLTVVLDREGYVQEISCG